MVNFNQSLPEKGNTDFMEDKNTNNYTWSHEWFIFLGNNKDCRISK